MQTYKTYSEAGLLGCVFQ